MATITTPENRSPAHLELAQAGMQAVLDALSPGDGSVWTCSLVDYDSIALDNTALTVALPLRGDLEGTLFLSVSFTAAPELQAAIAGSAAGTPEAAALRLASAISRTLRELLSTSLGAVTFGEPSMTSLPSSPHPVTGIQLGAAPGSKALLLLAVDGGLEESLRRHADRKAGQGGTSLGNTPKPKIERVLDVPLAVTLRFGQRQLTLREVLALNTGSLVELDRQVEEAVDLVLGDRLIARGDVVIVDGNYGLRVTEVMEGASQSLRHLQRATGTTPSGEAAA